MKMKFGVLLSAFAMLVLAGVANAAEIVNLNKADAAAIQQNLIGIGPVKADAIVGYRKKNGKYSSIDDLQNVKGIGPALIKKNKRYLSLSKGVVKGDAKAYAAARKTAASKSSTKAKPKKKSSQTASKAKKETTSSKKKVDAAKADKKTPAKKKTTKKPAKKDTAKPSKKDKKKKKKKKPAT